MRDFGWCYLGAGSIANITAKELVKDGGKIISVWNRTKSKADKFAKKFDCIAYDDVISAIKAEGVNGVYINVVNSKHYELAKICIENKIPCLVEKPFTLNSKETEELLALASKNSVYVSEAMWTWHSPVAKTVKQWIKDNKIGKIVSAKGSFCLPFSLLSAKDRKINPDLGGGVLYDLGVYPVRYFYELFGKPDKIECKADLKNGCDINDKIVFYYDDFNAVINCSFTKFHGYSLKIKGENGSIYVPMLNAAKNAYLKGKNKSKITCKNRLYSLQFKEVEKEILSGNLCPINVTHFGTSEVMKLIDECHEKMGIYFKK